MTIELEATPADDPPKSSRNVLVENMFGNTDTGYFIDGQWFDTAGRQIKVKSWCEMPKLVLKQEASAK